MLTHEYCRQRQTRFRVALAVAGIDGAVLTDVRDIYYFTGRLFDSPFGQPACLFLNTTGGGWVVGPSNTGVGCVDEVLTYAPSLAGTMYLDWTGRLVEQFARKLQGQPKFGRLGFQGESLPHALALALEHLAPRQQWSPIDSLLLNLQRRKDPDEVELIRTAIRCDLAAYDAVQQAIAPGVSEVEVLTAGTSAALGAAGEPISHDGDYQCASIGGKARNRRIDAREMYVVDAWTRYRGYWCDLSRTFSVGNQPTDLQQSVFDHVAAAHDKLIPMLKPGVTGDEITRSTDAYLRQHPALRDVGLVHHAGHGTGIRVHMAPDLNIGSTDVLTEGDLVCFEPGVYLPGPNVYVRLENTYQITAGGPVNLVDYPFELSRKV